MAMDQAAAEDQARAAATGGYGNAALERLVEQVGGKASVAAVFGAPIERGDLTVVPVARVRWGFGGGSGYGEAAGPGEQAPGGTGGAGGVSADPVGYLEIGPDGASFRPIVPPYPNALFVLAAAVSVAVMVRAAARLLRG